MAPPAAADLTVVPNSTSVYTLQDSDAGTTLFTATGQTVGEDNILVVKSVPDSSAWQLTVGFIYHSDGAANSMAGICARNSTTREFRNLQFAVQNGTLPTMGARGSPRGSPGSASDPGRGTNEDASLPNPTGKFQSFYGRPCWLRLVGSSTALTYYISSDGRLWRQALSVLHTATTGFTQPPNQAGVILNPYGSTFVGATIVSWEME